MTPQQRLEKLALTDPVIHQCLTLMYPTQAPLEEVMIMVIEAMTEQRDRYFTELLRIHQNSTPTIIVGGDKP